MKKIICPLSLLLFLIFKSSIILFAQNDCGVFLQKIDAKKYAGKKFKFQAVVKIEPLTSSCEAEIWFRVDRVNKKRGFFNNMTNTPIKTISWKIFTIEGLIDKDADSIAFGGMYFRKGVFYFDNFKFFIENVKGNYEEQNIADGNFEEQYFNTNWLFFPRGEGFTISSTNETFFEGKQSCKVDGTNYHPIFTYGDNDSTGKYANVNGVKIYYEEYGSGEPLLLLHGNSESIQSFRLQIPELSKKYKVIAVDTRGHGKSSEDGKLYTYDLFADDMNALLNELKFDSVNILGWSDGGNTGLTMAMKYPKKVKRLITMGANIFIDKSVVEKWVFKELNKQIVDLTNDTAFNSKNRIRLIILLLTEPKLRFDQLNVINCPVLVMAGEKDIILGAHTKAIAANINKSTLVIAKKETHYFPLENAAIFNKIVIEWLDKPCK